MVCCASQRVDGGQVLEGSVKLMVNNKMFSNSKQTNMYGGVPPPYPPRPGMYIPSDIKGLRRP